MYECMHGCMDVCNIKGIKDDKSKFPENLLIKIG